MRILLSNDDGIYAPGIEALYDAVNGLGEIHIVAPDSQRSAVGHAITLSDPIKTKEVLREGTFFGHAVGGTPADCVKLAVCGLLKERPELVIRRHRGQTVNRHFTLRRVGRSRRSRPAQSIPSA